MANGRGSPWLLRPVSLSPGFGGGGQDARACSTGNSERHWEPQRHEGHEGKGRGIRGWARMRGGCGAYAGWKPALPEQPRMQAEACGTRNGKAVRGWARMRGGCAAYAGWKPALPEQPRMQAEACGTRNGKAVRGWARMRGGCAAYAGWKPALPGKANGRRAWVRPPYRTGTARRAWVRPPYRTGTARRALRVSSG